MSAHGRGALIGQAPTESLALDLAILGPLEVWRNGKPLDLGGAKQRMLLAALALEANRVVSDDELVKIIWGDEPADGVVDALRVHVHRLRRTIEPNGNCDHTEGRLLVRRPAGYSLLLKADELDLTRFRGLIAEARTAAGGGGHQQALALFDRALGLWRGPTLDDFGDAAFVAAYRVRFEKLRLEALEDRFDLCLRMGLHRENVSAIEALADEHPLRERLQSQLLVTLYRCGRQAEASDAYQRTRRRLLDDLGMEPGPDLQATFREILRHEVSPVRSTEPEGRVHPPSATSSRTNLPAEVSSFIGRADQIAEVAELLASNRLVTLVGSGGIGKTRLALQVARRAVDRYRDGVWLIDLATVAEAEALPHEVMARLGLRQQPDLTPVQSLAGLLEPRHLLLVFDNCEHLVDATAELAQTLLRDCAALSILATSRERLNCDGEQAWSVPPLDTPNAARIPSVERLLEHDAVRLFVERAHKSRQSFALTAGNAGAVTQLCARLDGIPLAIELAAARSAALSPEELLEHLGNRFRLITGSRRATVSRHRTMQETIDWSHRLLTAQEQLMFRRLGVFAGSFDLAAAETVCADHDLPSAEVVELLAKLVDKSLVVYSDLVAGEGRYRLLETVRQFAQDKLANDPWGDRIRSRHATHYLSVGESFEQRYREVRSGTLVRRLDADYSNARAALEWAEGADAALFLCLAATWWHYWWLQGSLTEGRVWLDRALAMQGGSNRARGRALSGKGRLAAIQGDIGEAEAAFVEGMALSLQADDQPNVAVLHNSLGILANKRDDAAGAEAHFRQAVAVWELLKIPVGLMAGYGNLGETCFYRGDFEQARAWYEAAIRLGFEDCLGTVTVRNSLANLERHVGSYSVARDHAVASLRIAHRTEFALGLSTTMETCAFIAAATDRPFRAAVLAAAVESIAARCGAAPDSLPDRDAAERTVSRVCGLLDEETLARARSLGAAMTIDEAVAYAIGDDDDAADPPLDVLPLVGRRIGEVRAV
jgi:predicted ATPase/DNA-binding SARP family transcriptional activator